MHGRDESSIKMHLSYHDDLFTNNREQGELKVGFNAN